MRSKSRVFRLTAVSMTVLMFVVAGPYQAAVAALIPTGNTIASTDAANARENIANFISRQDVQNYFISMGIDPEEASARINSLTDEEALRVSTHMEKFHAGGNGIGIIVGASLIVFFVLLITDLLGLTNVFPFVKKHR